MSFGLQTRVGKRNNVLDSDPDPPTGRKTFHGMILAVRRPFTNSLWTCGQWYIADFTPGAIFTMSTCWCLSLTEHAVIVLADTLSPPKNTHDMMHNTAHCVKNMSIFTKPEVHNISQRRQRRIEPRPQATCSENLVKLASVVFEICELTDRQTHRQTRPSHCFSAVVISYFSLVINFIFVYYVQFVSTVTKAAGE